MSVSDVLISQYRAALAMLRSAIEACPDRMWDDPAHTNRFWQIAYHTLFYTHLYSSRSEEEFRAWEKARTYYNILGPLPWPPHERVVVDAIYSRAELLEYCGVVDDAVARGIEALDFDAPSGFTWLPFTALEKQIYTLRHIQHHAGQLIERLRHEADIGIDWVGRAVGIGNEEARN